MLDRKEPENVRVMMCHLTHEGEGKKEHKCKKNRGKYMIESYEV